jgi:UDP-N-acetylmuramoyl-tripeptide--D-alanyl-D-alanine ligase
MMTLQQAAQAIGAIATANVSFTSVFSDSRAVEAGGLFVALRGERFDGHDFVAEVLAKGAAAALVDQAFATAHPDLPLLVVDDTRRGLGQLAAHWRRQFSIPVIGVTGSNGKTTVKEMIAAILAAAHGEENRLATRGNLNNDIGLPLTVLRLRSHHKAAVIELGMNHPGETAELAAIAQPTIGLINNAQREHQEFMKTVAAVAEEHGALIDALDASGVVVIGADEEFADYWRGLAGSRPVRDFGIEKPAAVGDRYHLDAHGADLELNTPEGTVALRLATAGVHNVRNALAAVAATTAAGVSLAAVKAGLEAFRPVKGRLQSKRGLKGAAIIDDSYNANPDSVRAAIDVLAALPGKRLLVLGDMGEVGDRGGEYHAEIGGHARSQGVDGLYTLGEMTVATAHNFGGGSHFGSVDALVAALKPQLDASTTVLVKGSRFMRMERVVDALTEQPSENSHAA